MRSSEARRYSSAEKDAQVQAGAELFSIWSAAILAALVFFHPAFGLGFGLWAGSLWAWGYPYYGSYPYSYPYYSDSYPYVSSDDSAPYTDTSGVDVQLGGLIFDVNPSSAELFVDGNPVGSVSQFTPTTQQPLGLAPGRHHVEIRAAGYHAVSLTRTSPLVR
jgi:hypothetical protein